MTRIPLCKPNHIHLTLGVESESRLILQTEKHINSYRIKDDVIKMTLIDKYIELVRRTALFFLSLSLFIYLFINLFILLIYFYLNK